jgi:peptidyl-prolyl cis-trans isomerase SurA
MMIRFVLVALLAAIAQPALAATHAVRNTDTDGDGSLRDAVSAASKGDTIVFGSVVRGTITVEEPLDIDGLNLKGPGADVVTIRGTGEATLRLDSTVTISGLTLSGGDTTIAIANGKVTLLDAAVTDSRGVGVKIEDGRLTLVRSEISGNAGAGVESGDAAISCVNSTIADNGGAGMRADSGHVDSSSCTIAHNRGAGIEAGAGGATVHNTLFADNLRGCDGAVTSKGFNLSDDESCALSQNGDVQNPDPRVAALGANGGPTQTVALTGGSPAIDAGDPTGCTDDAGGLLAADQRGTRRPSGGRCDIGAFEQPVAVTGTVVNRIVALVDGDPITMHEVSTFTASDPRLAEAARTDQGSVLDLLVTQRILEKEVQAQGITISEAEIDRYIDSIKQRNNLNDDQLDAALNQQGLTRERYRKQIKEELERAQLINREIRGKVSVSPEEIERYRKDQGEPGAAQSDEQVSISHIVLQIPPGASPEDIAAIQARADKIYEELESGADFAEVAKRESEDGAASAGGKLGTFKKGEMRDELEEAVAGLEPGEVSKPVRAENSIHIVRLDERIGAGTETTKLSDSAREEIKEKLYTQALEARYARWLKEDLRQKHSVEMLP